ncbi:MAG: alpha-hydroxy acid oxidase [Candidatus Binatia bacterium]
MDFLTNQEIIMAARRNRSDNVWHYLTGGAESETTMLHNRFGLDSLAFRPRVLVDVSDIDPSTTFLGHKLAIPVMLAPIGSLQSITPAGGVAVAKAAEEFGTVNFVSSVTQPSLEEIAAASRNPKIFQLYVQGDLKWVGDLLTRVKAAGYSALCLTVDTAHYGHRERQMMDRWLPPSRRGVGYEYRAGLTWETLDAIKEMAGLPFILKGVATAEDAAIAVAHGVGTIYVSNHGGRQLDHGRATIDMLPEIVDAVGGKAEILLYHPSAPDKRDVLGQSATPAVRRDATPVAGLTHRVLWTTRYRASISDSAPYRALARSAGASPPRPTRLAALALGESRPITPRTPLHPSG